MAYISGMDRNQITFLPERVEDYVDENNSTRVIDAYINSLDLGKLNFSSSRPSDIGRPPYAPKDMLKLYLYGYMNHIRSSRRLETETKRNLEVIWLLGGLAPDHKTIARFRHDNAAALKQVFRDFVKLCVKQGLYGKELVAIDGSKFKAVNSKKRNFSETKLRERIASMDTKIAAYLAELEENDGQENASGGPKSREEIGRIVKELSERKERYEGYAKELKESGETQKSLTDGDSRLMPANGKMDVCYNVQTAVDAKHKLIAEFEVTNSATDKNQLTPMVEQTRETLEAVPSAIVADAGYDSAQDIAGSIGLGIAVHVAGTDFDMCVVTDEAPAAAITEQRNGRCVYVAGRNIALCPMGKTLYPRFYKKNRGQGVFYNREACRQCACPCTTEKRGRNHRVPMAAADFSKTYDERGLLVKQIHVAPDKEIVKQRKCVVEHPFGTIKRAMDAGYCLTKGVANVAGEFSLTFLAYNLKRVINILGGKRLIECLER